MQGGVFCSDPELYFIWLCKNQTSKLPSFQMLQQFNFFILLNLAHWVRWFLRPWPKWRFRSHPQSPWILELHQVHDVFGDMFSGLEIFILHYQYHLIWENELQPGCIQIAMFDACTQPSLLYYFCCSVILRWNRTGQAVVIEGWRPSKIVCLFILTWFLNYWWTNIPDPPCEK